MFNAHQITARLQAAKIPFRTIDHPAVFTAAEADHYVQGETFARTKNLFLTTSKHDHYYLLLIPETKRLDTRRFRQQAGTSRITFASVDELLAKLDLTPGSVSPFGLLNNRDHDVKLFVDRDVAQSPTIGCHPNDNTKTTVLATQDLLDFLGQAGFPAQLIDL